MRRFDTDRKMMSFGSCRPYNLDSSQLARRRSPIHIDAVVQQMQGLGIDRRLFIRCNFGEPQARQNMHNLHNTHDTHSTQGARPEWERTDGTFAA